MVQRECKYARNLPASHPPPPSSHNRIHLRKQQLTKSNSYTNFARGDEDPAYLYGGGERLEKLKALKSKWDPERAFGWYNPIC